ncbi:MAG: F0F1 ATP synthase subunit B [Candidatus Kerfeldbacteria bacterium]|nr:F0F1 ATP synthase subunit B [Candidatus Kerfeldbacteria bacterium]
MELLEKFGINFPVLIAQIINFLIVLFILYRFAYRPILKLLHDRTAKIEKSLKEVDEIHARLKSAGEEKDQVLTAARKEAQTILAEANRRASEQQEETLNQTKQKLADLTKKTEEELTRARRDMVQHAQEEMAKMVVQVSEKILSENIDAQKNRALIERGLSTFTAKQS